MKTLIISGTVKQGPSNLVTYDISLFGQSKESPLCVFIRSLHLVSSGYNEMQTICRDHYAEYFNTDPSNIVSMENITMI